MVKMVCPMTVNDQAGDLSIFSAMTYIGQKERRREGSHTPLFFKICITGHLPDNLIYEKRNSL